MHYKLNKQTDKQINRQTDTEEQMGSDITEEKKLHGRVSRRLYVR